MGLTVIAIRCCPKLFLLASGNVACMVVRHWLCLVSFCWRHWIVPRKKFPVAKWGQHHDNRAHSRLAPSQWETLLLSNAVSHWLDTNHPCDNITTVESGLAFSQNSRNLYPILHPIQTVIYVFPWHIWVFFYPRPVLAFRYCCCLSVCLVLSVCAQVCASVCQPWACLHDDLWLIQAKSAKFGPEVQNTFVKIRIGLGSDWPWPSRSNLISKSKFLHAWFDHQSK